MATSTTPSQTTHSPTNRSRTAGAPPTPVEVDISAPDAAAKPTAEPALSTRAWLEGSISGVLAAVVGISWYALFALSAAVEPESSHDVPIIGLVLGVALLGAMLATGIGLAMTRRWGLVAALGASVLLLASAVACPTTGHHTIGTWWYLQMACSFAAVGLTTTALRRS